MITLGIPFMLILGIYLLSVICCLCGTGERLFIERERGNVVDKKLLKLDLIVSFTPFFNTWYMMYSIYVTITSSVKHLIIKK